MVKRTARKPDRDPSAGGKRSAMPAQDEGPAAEDAGYRGNLGQGLQALSAALPGLPNGPGVYRMLKRGGDPLYVGKAKSLKKRVASYTQLSRLPRRLQRMVGETVALEVIETASEVEALLLESNLINRFMPRYNVLLRDDKSFPYILITDDQAVPLVTKHRGARDRSGDYFGPFASAGAVNRTITALERAFLLRSCSDAVYQQRQRPCLLYQIKRCSAPCVGRIGEADYGALVEQARAFLRGDSSDLQHDLARAMEAAAERLDYEGAAVFRDRIRALAHIQARQDINVEGIDDADVIAAVQEGGETCVQVFFFRAGRNYGNRAYFPSHDKTLGLAPVLSAFIAQFYDNKLPPRLLLVNEMPEECGLLAAALASRAKRRVVLRVPQRGSKRNIVENATRNAREALARRLSESRSQQKLYGRMRDVLSLDGPPQRVEIYDNSHIQGSDAYGAMVVAGPEGFRKSAYRKFGIKGAASPAQSKAVAAPGAAFAESAQAPYSAGDDYAMMREVLTRRFSRALKEDPERGSENWPDLLIIDGGRGQLGVALEVLTGFGLDDIPVIAVAKGPDRDAGREKIFMAESPPLMLEPRDPLLYLIQRLRDEAHRFAISAHRMGRKKSRLRSRLDGVPGIGAKRKRALLLHFGSAQAVTRAGVADLEAVEGISQTVAKKLHAHFNG